MSEVKIGGTDTRPKEVILRELVKAQSEIYHARAECDRLASDTYWIDRAMQAERTLDSVREIANDFFLNIGLWSMKLPPWVHEIATKLDKALNPIPTPGKKQ